MPFHIILEDRVCQMSVGSHRKQILSMDGGVMEVFVLFFRIISVIDKGRRRKEWVRRASDCNADLIKSMRTQWGTPDRRLCIRGAHDGQGCPVPTTPAVLSH